MVSTKTNATKGDGRACTCGLLIPVDNPCANFFIKQVIGIFFIGDNACGESIGSVVCFIDGFVKTADADALEKRAEDFDVLAVLEGGDIDESWGEKGGVGGYRAKWN